MSNSNLKDKINLALKKQKQGLISLSETDELFTSMAFSNEQKVYLKDSYDLVNFTAAKDKSKISGYSTICKAIFLQKRVFFALTKNQHKNNVDQDPDNQLKVNQNWPPFINFLSKLDIIQLWDSVGRKAGGYLIYDKTILNLLGLTDAQLNTQLNELLEFTKFSNFDRTLVFDEIGELRVKSEEIRTKIKEERAKKKELSIKNLDSSLEKTKSNLDFNGTGYLNSPVHQNSEKLYQHSPLSDQNKSSLPQNSFKAPSFRRPNLSINSIKVEEVFNLTEPLLRSVWINYSQDIKSFEQKSKPLFSNIISDIDALNYNEKVELKSKIKAHLIQKEYSAAASEDISELVISLEETCS